MKVCKNFDLTNYNSYKLKSLCNEAFFPESEEELLDLLKLKKNFIVIGNGNNIIFSKEIYSEPFIILNNTFDKIFLEKDCVVAEAGATTIQLCEFALKHKLSGCEFLFDIPSSIGGAVFMNAGTKEGETKNILKTVNYIDLKNNSLKKITNKEINFRYRNSYFQKTGDKIITKAWFKLKEGDPKNIQTKMNSSKHRRWEKQPRNYPNAGSVFKRPKGHFVGPMIEDLGLKGFSIGGAKISEKHAGFIINYNNAAAIDILNLINEIKIRVKKKYKITLEVEQRII